MENFGAPANPMIPQGFGAHTPQTSPHFPLKESIATKRERNDHEEQAKKKRRKNIRAEMFNPNSKHEFYILHHPNNLKQPVFPVKDNTKKEQLLRLFKELSVPTRGIKVQTLPEQYCEGDTSVFCLTNNTSFLGRREVILCEKLVFETRAAAHNMPLISFK